MKRPLFARWPLIGALAFAAVVTAIPQAVQAQGFPNRPVRLIVPYPAGGPIDALGFKDYEASFFMGLPTCAGTPPAVIDKIANDARAILRSPEFREKNMGPYAFETVADSPGEFRAWLVKDRERQARLVKICGAKLD